MEKIIEIIPDNLPEWAVEAMKNGQLFKTMLERIRELESKMCDCEDDRLPCGCPTNGGCICIRY